MEGYGTAGDWKMVFHLANPITGSESSLLYFYPSK